MTVVTGRVADHTGKGVAGVYVYAVAAFGADQGARPAGHTDADGRWRLDLPPGGWQVRPVGYPSREIAVGDGPVDLDPAGPVQVRTTAPAVTGPASARAEQAAPARAAIRDGGRRALTRREPPAAAAPATPTPRPLRDGGRTPTRRSREES